MGSIVIRPHGFDFEVVVAAVPVAAITVAAAVVAGGHEEQEQLQCRNSG